MRDEGKTLHLCIIYRFKIEQPTKLGREKERPTQAEVAPAARPNTVNIYEEEPDPSRVLKGKSHDDQALSRYKDKVLKWINCAWLVFIYFFMTGTFLLQSLEFIDNKQDKDILV